MAEAAGLTPGDRRQVSTDLPGSGGMMGGRPRNIVPLSGASMDISATTRAFLAPGDPLTEPHW
jgi:hypothetical protein